MGTDAGWSGSGALALVLLAAVGCSAPRATDVGPGTTIVSAPIVSVGVEDEVRAVAVGPGSVVAFGGATAGQLTVDAPNGDLDAFVVLLEADGGERWRAQFGGAGEDAVTDLVVRDDGVVVAVGLTTEAWPALPDAIVVAFDGTTGATLWNHVVATPERDVAVAVVVDGEGRAYVAGTTRGSIAPFVSAGFDDVYVARFTPAGVLDAFVQFGGTGFDRAYDLALLPGGDVVLVGETGDVVPGAGPAFQGPAFAVRFAADLAASPVWVVQGGGTDGINLDLVALAVDPGGDLIAAGFTTGQVGPDPKQGDYDLVLARIAATDGTLSFVRQVGGANAHFGSSLAVDAAGRAWVGGTVFTFDPVEDTSEATLWVFGQDDALLLSEVVPVGTHGGATAVALAGDREVWLGGWAAAAMPGARSGWDGFLVRRRH